MTLSTPEEMTRSVLMCVCANNSITPAIIWPFKSLCMDPFELSLQSVFQYLSCLGIIMFWVTHEPVRDAIPGARFLDSAMWKLLGLAGALCATPRGTIDVLRAS